MTVKVKKVKMKINIKYIPVYGQQMQSGRVSICLNNWNILKKGVFMEILNFGKSIGSRNIGRIFDHISIKIEKQSCHPSKK